MTENCHQYATIITHTVHAVTASNQNETGAFIRQL